MNSKHVVSCFEGSLNGWYKQQQQSPPRRQTNILQRLQENLIKYEGQSNKAFMSKCLQRKVRLPQVLNYRHQTSLENQKYRQKTIKLITSLESSKKLFPLKMKTIVVSDKEQKENNEYFDMIKRKNKQKLAEKGQKLRKRIVINFERRKQMGNGPEFSDQKFFQNSEATKEKSKSVKLHIASRC